MKIDVIIPTYRPGDKFVRLIEMLNRQTHRPDRIILVNTDRRYFNTDIIRGCDNIRLYNIKKKEFDHGRVRHAAIMKSDADYVLLMTDDAVPADERLIENLISAFDDPSVATAYARQLPEEDCRIIEKYTRQFNYPDESSVKTKADLNRLGIKTYFCSDVCAMYDRAKYLELGGFEQKIIFNEDMVFASKVINSNYAIAYCSDAMVIHSHNYTNVQQFRRNFDMGVSQAVYSDIFQSVNSESEGLKMILATVKYLCSSGRFYYVPYLFINTVCKYAGYRLGRMYDKLPAGLIQICTLNKTYWIE